MKSHHRYTKELLCTFQTITHFSGKNNGNQCVCCPKMPLFHEFLVGSGFVHSGNFAVVCIVRVLIAQMFDA